MHRQTALTAGFVGYSAGGARTMIHEIDDSKLMQQMTGSMMFNELRSAVEAPQNYGFSSVVRPATKDANGMIQDCAEGFMSFMGGNRSASFCAIMDDRRFRPMGLKPGENAQYDDLGQMTLLRRTGLFLLTTDNPEQNSSSSGGAAAGQHDSGGSSGQTPQRYVSIRHVVKQAQPRPKRGSGQQSSGNGSGGGASPGTQDASSGGSGQSGSQDFQHEGETVNTEVRFSAKNFEFRTGDNVIGSHDKDAAKWSFGGKVHEITSTDSHSVTSKSVSLSGSQTVSISGTQGISLQGPTTVNGSPVATSMMLDARDQMIAALTARIAALELRLSA